MTSRFDLLAVATQIIMVVLYGMYFLWMGLYQVQISFIPLLIVLYAGYKISHYIASLLLGVKE